MITALTALLLAAASPGQASQCGGNTREINECMSERLGALEGVMSRYVTAARDRLKANERETAPGLGSVGDALPKFEEAQRTWLRYRDTECSAVYDYYSPGSIRNMQALACKMALTRERTHAIWTAWLSNLDSSPPVLPEPHSAKP